MRKVAWAADLLGLSYEREDWGKPFRDPKSPEFLGLNPNAMVPVLIEDDGFVLWESNAILHYLAEKHGAGRLLPTDIQARALVKQWLSWQASEVNPSWGYAQQALLRKTPGYDDPGRVTESVNKWIATMRILDGQLARNGTYVAGDAFSIADIALALSLHRYYSTPFEHPDLVHIQAYYERMKGEGGAPYMSEATP